MKIKTRKTNCYPGDNTIQIIAVDNKNRQIGLMNLNRKSVWGNRFYKNDRNGIKFNTITEAKQWCKNNKSNL